MQYYPSKKDILKFRFKISKLYIVLPISIILFSIFLYFFIQVGKHLTPYSIYVSGYFRKDGTYVSSYYRRPPGSVKYDLPYREKRTIFFILMVSTIVSSGISIFYFFKDTDEEVNFELNYSISKKILKEINFTLNLPQRPKKLYIRGINFFPNIFSTFYCNYCNTQFNSIDFFFGDLKKKNPTIICYSCLKNKPNIKDIDNILKYINNFEKDKNIFLSLYIEKFKAVTNAEPKDISFIENLYFSLVQYFESYYLFSKENTYKKFVEDF